MSDKTQERMSGDRLVAFPRSRALREAVESLDPERIGAIVARVAAKGRYQGDSGNCANFAAVLNLVLGAGGDYVTVDGGHYEYVNHVALRFRGVIIDHSGIVTEAYLLDAFGSSEDDEDEDEAEILDFPDPSPEGESVRRLADDDGIFAMPLDELAFARDLSAALIRAAKAVKRPPGAA